MEMLFTSWCPSYAILNVTLFNNVDKSNKVIWVLNDMSILPNQIFYFNSSGINLNELGFKFIDH